VETVRLFRCALEGCGAVFTVLPAFIARHLWRNWKTVQGATEGKAEPPKSTLLRWLGRLQSDASLLLQAVTAKAATLLRGSLLRCLSKVTTRASFLLTMAPSGLFSTGHLFALVAAWVHRLEPGIRLM
jgi:hypothetical protein